MPMLEKTSSRQNSLKEYDRVILACGQRIQETSKPGQDAEGIYFAVDF